MAKIIAVIGSPGSGKTTVTLKIAQELYCATSSGAVIYLSPSLKIPALGVLFPNYTPDSIFSLGKMLDKTDIYEEDVLNHLVTVKAMKNFGCLGYKAGENRYSYPDLTDDKVKALFDVLHTMAGYVFVDCTEEEDDLISQYALGMADEVIMVISPDLKSMVYTSLNIYNVKVNIKQLQEEAEDYMMKAATTEGDKSKYLEEVEKIFAKVKVLREQLEVLEATSSNANESSSKINRLTDILKASDFAIEEYDDLIVRRTIECIRVMSNKTIVIIFKGGFEMTESLEDMT